MWNNSLPKGVTLSCIIYVPSLTTLCIWRLGFPIRWLLIWWWSGVLPPFYFLSEISGSMSCAGDLSSFQILFPINVYINFFPPTLLWKLDWTTHFGLRWLEFGSQSTLSFFIRGGIKTNYQTVHWGGLFGPVWGLGLVLKEGSSFPGPGKCESISVSFPFLPSRQFYFSQLPIFPVSTSIHR